MASKNLSDVLKVTLNSDLLKKVYPLVTGNKATEAKTDVAKMLDKLGAKIDVSALTSNATVKKIIGPMIKELGTKLPWLKYVVSGIETKNLGALSGIDLTSLLGKTSSTSTDPTKILKSLGVKLDADSIMKKGSKLLKGFLK